MAHFAELDSDNIVLRVIVVSNEEVTDLSTESEGYVSNLVGSGKWKQTSYSHSFRGKYASIGDTYDAEKDAFISPQPYPSWSLDSNDIWQPPINVPGDHSPPEKVYVWDESAHQADNSTGWVES
tara:strand:+ start:36 stop:407 length:372 start_codon:yes stop_codon:yes gene_type:complete